MNSPYLPTISIVLPVYNGEHYLAECLKSVHAQTCADYELLVADDASTDGTPNIIQNLADDRWRVVRNPANRGLFANLNQLISLARAPLIHILCQDDALELDCLAQEVRFFAEHAQIAMSFCKYIKVDETGAEFGRSPIDDLPTVISPALARQYYYYYGCLPGNLSPVCVRRDSLLQAGLFDESFQVAGDFETWVRLCEQGDLGVLHRYLIRLRHHTQQLSRASSSRLAHVLETRRIRAQLLPLLPPEIRAAAARYTLQCQTVWDVHYTLRCLQAGQRGNFAQIVRAIGAHDFSWGLFYWLISANNHLFRPTPQIVGGPPING